PARARGAVDGAMTRRIVPAMRTAWVVAILVAGAASARAEEGREARARKLQAEGAALMQAGDLLRARTAFAAAQALVPERAKPYRWLGLVDAQLGRCEEAVKNLEVFLGKAAAGDARLAEVREARDRCRVRLAAT